MMNLIKRLFKKEKKEERIPNSYLMKMSYGDNMKIVDIDKEIYEDKIKRFEFIGKNRNQYAIEKGCSILDVKYEITPIY